MHARHLLISIVGVGISVGTAAAIINVETVSVGNPGNAPDSRSGDIHLGSVAYSYRMGKYDITAEQYTAFLNAVAATDPYELYNTHMDTTNDVYGCNIRRSGRSGSYTYSVAADWAKRPVNFVSWGDAARFANWLTNGQPTGAQSSSTTEDGSYALNGVTSNGDLLAVTRKAGARYVIPTENEWYKAAYYDVRKSGGPGYWLYSARSDSMPSNVLDPNGFNNANFIDYYSTGNGGYTVGPPYYRTEVGAFAGSPSAYGTFDQGGNVGQWNEGVYGGSINNPDNRGMRGGAFSCGVQVMSSECRNSSIPAGQLGDIGFRVAWVPEPATLMLLTLAGAGIARRTRPGRAR